ncbi:hypothetical protein ETC03_05790 [Geobacillus sp. MMMUD3]|nr:hypothetical protein [Geobacillus sp. MMMUD3]
MFDNQHSLGFHFGRFSTEGSFLGSSPNVVLHFSCIHKRIGNKAFFAYTFTEVHRLASTRFGDEPFIWHANHRMEAVFFISSPLRRRTNFSL